MEKRDDEYFKIGLGIKMAISFCSIQVVENQQQTFRYVHTKGLLN